MGKSQRVKGHSWERKVASDLREFDGSARRQLEYQEGMGVDISLESLPYSIQCKVGGKPPWLKAISEAVNSVNGSGRIPMAAIKVDNQGEYLVMRWSDFLKYFINKAEMNKTVN